MRIAHDVAGFVPLVGKLISNIYLRVYYGPAYYLVRINKGRPRRDGRHERCSSWGIVEILPRGSALTDNGVKKYLNSYYGQVLIT
jgi:hypothetical protein